MASLSRQLARWVVGLRPDDLPAAVVDRAKGVTLHGLASALIGSQTADGRHAVALVTDEEAGVRQGATILVHGTTVTRGGAAFANSELVFAGGKWDTFRMLTHPGTSIIPCALIAAETVGATGAEFLTGLAAGYEVAERMAADFIPTVMARGMTLFGPRITIHTKDGRSYTRQATGREFVWDFEEEARRIRDVVRVVPIAAPQFERLVAACRNLDREARADVLVQLTLAKP